VNFLQKFRLRFRRKTAEELRQRKIRRQLQEISRAIKNPAPWRNPHLWLLRSLSRSRRLEVTRAEEKSARMVSLLAARRRNRQTVKKTACGCKIIALLKGLRICRRRCRVLRQRIQIRLTRWLLIQVLCLLLRAILLMLPLLLSLLHSWLGQSQPCCDPSSSSRKSATASGCRR